MLLQQQQQEQQQQFIDIGGNAPGGDAEGAYGKEAMAQQEAADALYNQPAAGHSEAPANQAGVDQNQQVMAAGTESEATAFSSGLYRQIYASRANVFIS